MYFYGNIFAELADRVRGGDLEAREQFREELASALVLMVRQTLRDGKSTTSIARRILTVARRLTAQDGGVMMLAKTIVEIMITTKATMMTRHPKSERRARMKRSTISSQHSRPRAQRRTG